MALFVNCVFLRRRNDFLPNFVHAKIKDKANGIFINSWLRPGPYLVNPIPKTMSTNASKSATSTS